MKILSSFLRAATIVLAISGAVSAQAPTQPVPGDASQPAPSGREMTDDDIVRLVFDPVTDELKLTPAQKYRIVTIASGAMSSTQPLFAQIDELDNQMSVAAFSGNLDDAKLKELSTRQAALVSEVSMTIARAKTRFYSILTAGQRDIVLGKYRTPDQSLGGLSNVGP